MTRTEAAVAAFNKGFACSQAVLSAFAPDHGMDAQTALKVAAGFGGGMGRMALTCGAVTGAFMVIGLKCGGTNPGDQEAKQKTYRLVRDFAARFEARNGSISCRDLLGCDIGTPDGFEFAKRNNLMKSRCPKIVEDASEILEQVLSEG